MSSPVIPPVFGVLREACAAALAGRLGSVALRDGVRAAELLALAERHRVVPLCAAGLVEEDRAPFRRRVLALAQQMTRLEQELGRIAAIWQGAGVEFLVLKGPALARQAYPLPEWRVSDDIDLWVPARELEKAVAALEKNGYEPWSPLPPRVAACARRAGIETALRHPRDERLIEVGQGTDALAPSRRAAADMRARAAALEIGGRSVRAPHPLHALLHACRHGAHHAWDRLAWVADAAGLWQTLSAEERGEVCALARAWRQETILGIGLRLAREHLGSRLSGPAEALAEAGAARKLAARVRLEDIGPEPTRRPMLERLLFERDAMDLARQRWRMMAGWALIPTLGDMEAVPLPPALYQLYHLIRPLRLLRHPWRSEWRKRRRADAAAAVRH